MFARDRLGQVAATQATQLCLELGLHRRDGEHVLPRQQVDAQRFVAARRVGHRDRAVTQQFVVGDRLLVHGQRMVRRHREHELDLAQRPQFDAHRRRGRGAADADRQIGLAAQQRFPGAAEHLAAQPQPRARPFVAAFAGPQREEGIAQLEHRQARDHAVDRDRELRLPAAGYAAHAVGHRVHLGQQAPSLAQQFLAGGGEHGLARAAVEQQHVQRVLELAHAVGQRRRHLAQLARRGREAAGLGDRVHHHQGVGGQGVAAVRHRLRLDGFILFERALQAPRAPGFARLPTVTTSC